MKTKEIIGLGGLAVMIIVGSILAVRQKFYGTTPLIDDTELNELAAQDPKKLEIQQTGESEPKTIEAQRVDTPQLVYIEQTESEESPDIKTVKLFTWDPTTADAPSEQATIDGNVLETFLQENATVRIDTSNSLQPIEHAFVGLNGATIDGNVTPSQGNYLVVQTTLSGDKSATLELDPLNGTALELHTQKESITLEASNFTTGDTEWTHITPFGFSADGNVLYILAEDRDGESIKDTGLYAYHIEKQEAEEFFRDQPENQQTSIKLVKNSTATNTLILERTKNSTTTIQQYDVDTRKYTLLLSADTLRGKIIEKPDHIAPNTENVILFDEDTEEYSIYNTITEEETPWNRKDRPIGWLSNDQIAASTSTALSVVGIDQVTATERTLKVPALGTSRIIIGIIPDTTAISTQTPSTSEE